VVKLPVYKYELKSGKKLYYVKLSVSGKQFIKRGFTNKNDAILYEATIIRNPNKIRGTGFICKELVSKFEKYINENYKATSSYTKLLAFRKHVLPFFADMRVSNITNVTLQIFADKINSPRTKLKNPFKEFRVAKDFLEFLKNYGASDLNYNCLKAPYNSDKQKTIYNYYTEEEFNKFISVVDSPRYKLVFDLLFYYGLRISECLGLRFKDFTKDRVFICGGVTAKTANKGQIHMSTKTSSSDRDYPLLNIIRDDFRNYLKTFPDGVSKNDYVFKSKHGLTIGENPIREAQKKYEKLSGSKHIKPHEFRHSCATVLINNGFSPEQVAAWLGHSSSVVTLKTYFHLFPSKKNEIGDYFNKTSCPINADK